MTTAGDIDRIQELRRVVAATARRYPHLSVLAIARLYAVPRSDVAAALKRAGIERPETSANDEYTPDNVRADADAGLRPPAIARHYGVSEMEIRLIVGPEITQEVFPVSTDPVPSTHEVPTPKPQSGRRVRVDPVQVARLRADGLTWPEIAERLGCAVSTPSVIASKHGFGGGPEAARRWLAEREAVTTPAEPALPADTWPERDESTVRVVRRGLSGSEARRYVEGAAKHLADEYRYDLQIILREVV